MPDMQYAGSEKVKQAMNALPDLMQKAAKRALNTHGNRFINVFTKKRLSGRPGLERRTGTLSRQGFAFNVIEEAGKISLRVWSQVKYAPMQEFGSAGLPGGVLRPKKSQYLAIPTEAATTGVGVSRYISPREVSGLFVARGRNSGKLFLGKMEGDSIVAYFLLRKEVRIPARMKLRETWKDEAPKANKLMEQAADKVLAGKFKRI